ncbi:MAG: FG-GAP repeat protein [Ignavibacteria bacterium]|nr:FG-GAP repeat protein [Ignavibacteria bacterium]
MTSEEGFFATSVSTAGDVNNDGYSDLIVGLMHMVTQMQEEHTFSLAMLLWTMSLTSECQETVKMLTSVLQFLLQAM